MIARADRGRAAHGAPTRVVVNGRFLTRPVTGVERYAIELTRRLRRVPGLQVEVLTPPDVADEALARELGARRVGSLRGHAWEQATLVRASAGRLLLNPCNSYPLARTRQLVAIHDAGVFAVPQAYSRAFRGWYRVLLRAARARTLGILTVSAFSRDELARRAGIPRAHVHLAPGGTDHLARVAPDRSVLARHGLRRPFVLALGSRSPHKNLEGLERAAELLADAPFDIVAAGGSNRAVFGDRGDAGGGRVRPLGRVSDGELRALYEAAGAFVQPSLYEGFGIPPLEAMTFGCPVVAARRAALPEVCGEAAVYVDPTDPRALAGALRRVMADERLRTAMTRRGRERAAGFRWDATCRAWVDVIHAVERASRPLASRP